MKLFFLVLVLSVNAHAETFAEKCSTIAACAIVVGEMLDQKYVFQTEARGKLEATPNLELTQDNAELLFTNLLFMNGYSRVPLGTPKTWQIMKMRDARDQQVPVVSATQEDAPELPNNYDLYTLKYKATHPGSVQQIGRTARNFMPAHARIIPEVESGILLATDTAINLKKLYGIMKDLDVKQLAEKLGVKKAAVPPPQEQKK